MVAVGANLYRGGWFAVRIDDQLGGQAAAGVYPDVTALINACNDASVVLIGVPIGLPDAQHPDRRVDREVRRVLGRTRNSSVFPVPSREAVTALQSCEASTYEALSDFNHRALGKRLSKQTAALLPKIAEVDEYLSTKTGAVPKIREAHRELCFWGLSGRQPMSHAKTTPEGAAERLDVLGDYLAWAREFVHDLRRDRRRQVPQPVVLDALATALTAAGHPAWAVSSPSPRSRKWTRAGCPWRWSADCPARQGTLTAPEEVLHLPPLRSLLPGWRRLPDPGDETG